MGHKVSIIPSPLYFISGSPHRKTQEGSGGGVGAAAGKKATPWLPTFQSTPSFSVAAGMLSAQSAGAGASSTRGPVLLFRVVFVSCPKHGIPNTHDFSCVVQVDLKGFLNSVLTKMGEEE
jgi:hypothetical protein